LHPDGVGLDAPHAPPAAAHVAGAPEVAGERPAGTAFERWALVALLCYVIPLHARYVGWVGDFGLAVCSVVCFSSVVLRMPSRPMATPGFSPTMPRFEGSPKMECRIPATLGEVECRGTDEPDHHDAGQDFPDLVAVPRL